MTVVAEEAFVLRTLQEVLDYRPKFDFAAINIPFGYPEHPQGQYRLCDQEARQLVGWPHMVKLHPVPSRPALFAKSRKEALELEPWLTKNDFRHFRWMKEAATEIQPFHSRSVYSGNAALSFQHMNGDEPLTTSSYHEDGRLATPRADPLEAAGRRRRGHQGAAQRGRPGAHVRGGGDVVDGSPCVRACD